MQISVTAGPITVLSVKGNIDATSFRELAEKGEGVLNQGYSKLVLDLHEVSYISSAGLMAIQTIAGKATAKGGKLVIAGLNPQVKRVVELGGFDKILTISSDVAAAKTSLA